MVETPLYGRKPPKKCALNVKAHTAIIWFSGFETGCALMKLATESTVSRRAPVL